jgi:hypothetical protein
MTEALLRAMTAKGTADEVWTIRCRRNDVDFRTCSSLYGDQHQTKLERWKRPAEESIAKHQYL